jgi:hypothetical protein
MTKSLSNILKTSSNILSANSGGTGLTSVGNTGNVLTSTGSGWISSVPFSYTLPTANTITLGGVKVDGTTITANNGVISGAAQTKTISNKTGAYTVILSDLGKIINCTSNTFTVSLTAAASLGSGFTCTIWNTSNTSTDAITIDPSGAETIDGVATLILRRGEGMDIVCNGTNWQTSYKKVMRGYTENTNSLDTRPIAFGTGALALGVGTNTSGTYAISVGYLASATSSYGFAGGTNSSGQGSVTATGSGAMALGGSYASGTDSFAAAITNNTSSYGALAANAIAIGKLAKASSANSVAIGSGSSGVGATASGTGAISLGSSYASGIDSVAIAIANNTSSFGATGNNSIAMGMRARATTANSVAIGYSSYTTGTYAIAIGYTATASGVNSVAFGNSTNAGSDNSSAIGSNSSGQGSLTYSASGAMALGGSYASGQDSFAAGGANNTSAYGAKATGAIMIGSYALASNYYAIAMGSGAQATGIGSVAIGGYNGTNWATGQSAIAFGDGARATQLGKYAFTGNNFAASGDSQFGKIVLRAVTTTTAAVVLTSDNGGTVSTTNQLIVASGQAMTFFGTLIAKQTASANMASYMFKGAIVNNGGTVSISSISIETIVDTIGLTTQPTFTADNTNKGLAVTSGAKSGTNIRWVCNIDSVEVTYA